MNYEHYIAEALDIVSAWEIPPEDIAQVINDQARIMAGTYLDPMTDLPFDDPRYTLPC